LEEPRQAKAMTEAGHYKGQAWCLAIAAAVMVLMILTLDYGMAIEFPVGCFAIIFSIFAGNLATQAVRAKREEVQAKAKKQSASE
jgi:hypothetical protein